MSKTITVVDRNHDFLNSDGKLYVSDMEQAVAKRLRFAMIRESVVLVPRSWGPDGVDLNPPSLNPDEVWPPHCVIGKS